MLWPLGQMFTFANPRKILKNILGWEKDQDQMRILVIAGEKDRLMSVSIMERLARGLRKAARGLGLYSQDEGEKGVGEEVVGFEIVKGSGKSSSQRNFLRSCEFRRQETIFLYS